MLFASVCLIVGMLVIVASEAQGLISKPGGVNANSTGRKQAQMLTLVKGEVHAYPQRGGKVREIHDPNQTDLEFDVFNSLLVVARAEMTLRITDLQLTLKGNDGSTRVGERVKGELKNWQLCDGIGNEEESDWPAVTIRRAPAGLPELDTAAPLECGAPPRGLVTLSNSEHHSFGVEEWIA